MRKQQYAPNEVPISYKAILRSHAKQTERTLWKTNVLKPFHVSFHGIPARLYPQRPKQLYAVLRYFAHTLEAMALTVSRLTWTVQSFKTLTRSEKHWEQIEARLTVQPSSAAHGGSYREVAKTARSP
jgi:hypothetical protein